MMDNKNGILLSLSRLGLSLDQAKVYVCLLEGGSMSHLQIARLTGVNRTKVYRIVDDLESSSLASIETSDAGKTVIAASPKNLEVKLTTEESKLNNKKAVLAQTLPKLNKIFNKKDDELKFTVNTYEGVSGLKQMLWNELKAKGELLGFGSGTIEDLTGSKNWSEKHRAKTVDANYKIREINNRGKKPINFTENTDFHANFERRYIDENILNIEQQIIIYNDTVSVYHWRDQQKVGFETINKAYADTMRQMFESYWVISKELGS
jgi:sugar-specific transcriptional regulator TrmB